jgi:hypothetical protein
MTHRIVALVLWAALSAALRAEPFEQAEITRTVNLVSLLREMEAAQAAAVGDVIKGETALKTGGDSRAELEFPDDTITRVGSNALFRFYAGARNMTLDGGTMLFSSPKGIGGGTVQAGAITAAVSGTDFLITYVKGLATKGGKVQVICLSETVVVVSSLRQISAERRRNSQAISEIRFLVADYEAGGTFYVRNSDQDSFNQVATLAGQYRVQRLTTQLRSQYLVH